MRAILTYGAATLVSGLTATVSIPLLVHSLDLAGFGAWGIAESVILLGSQLILVGTNFAIYEAMRGGVAQADEIAARWLVKLAFVFAAVLPLLLAIGLAANISLVRVSLVWVGLGCEALYMLTQASSRAGGRAERFFWLVAVKSTIWLCLLGLCAYRGGATFDHVLGARALSSLVPGLVLVLGRTGLRQEEGVAFGFVEAVKYGMPIAVASTLSAATEAMERMLVASEGSLAVAGSYLMAHKYAAILTMGLLAPIGLWWPAERARLRELGDKGLPIFTRIQVLAALVGFIAASAFLAVSPWSMKVLFAGRELPSVLVTTLVMYSVLLRGLMPILGPGAMEQGATWISGASLAFGALVQFSLLAILLPILPGRVMESAAWSLLASSLAAAAMYMVLAGSRLKVEGCKRVLATLLLVMSIAGPLLVVCLS